MTILWLSLLIIPCGLLYLLMMDIHANREKKERDERIQRLIQDATGDPEKLHQIEIYEIENNLADKITEKLFKVLSDEDSGDFYKGAFKDNKPDINELAESLVEHGYQPDMFDGKVSNILSKLSQDTDLAFLLNHGVRKEAEVRLQLKKQKSS